MIYKLWDDNNKTIFSDVFSVAPGYVVLLFAAGLSHHRHRPDTYSPAGPQAVDVRRLYFEYTQLDIQARYGDACGWIFEPKREDFAQEIENHCICINSCSWRLSPKTNLRIIGVPGTYMLELNDSTAIGVAQVYAERYKVGDIPHQVANLFFS